MKQHPIDRLFAGKLDKHTLTPERANWDEMQKRLQPATRLRIGVWGWYAVAASVLLILGIGWRTWRNTGEPIESTAIVRVVPKRTLPTVPFRQNALDKAENEINLPPNETIRAGEVAQIRKSQSREVLVLTPVTRNDEPVFAEIAKPTEDAEPITWPQQTINSRPAEESEKTLVVRIDEPDQMASVSTTNEEPQPKKKRIRVGRLLRQLNNLREGEPVDWKDAGMDGNTLVVKASTMVETGRERITESYETLRTKAFNRETNNKSP